MKLLKICLSTAVLLALATSTRYARADIIFDPPGTVAQPDENLLMVKDVMGQTIMGVTNNTATSFSATSINLLQDLINTANGQAVIEGVGGVPYDGFTLYPTSMDIVFTELEFNVDAPGQGNNTLIDALEVLVYGIDTLGNNTEELLASMFFDLDTAGVNRIGVKSENGQFITAVELRTEENIMDVTQIRLGGIDEIPMDQDDADDLDADDADDLDADDADDQDADDADDLDADDLDADDFDDADLDIIIDLDADDADTDDAVIPEPSSILAWLVVLSGLSLYGWRRHRRNRD